MKVAIINIPAFSRKNPSFVPNGTTVSLDNPKGAQTFTEAYPIGVKYDVERFLAVCLAATFENRIKANSIAEPAGVRSGRKKQSIGGFQKPPQ